MRLIKKNISVLKLLSKANKKKRDKILDDADEELIKCLCEIGENTLYNNVSLNDCQYKKLSRHRKSIRKLCKKGESWKKKKKFLKQTGGFLPYLIGPLLSFVLEKVF